MRKQILKNDWQDLLQEEFSKDYYLQLREFLIEEYSSQTIYPPMHDIYNALHLTPFSEVKVVILGQDPYHGPNQGHGLNYSVQANVPNPPSLVNAFHDVENDLNHELPVDGNLVI